VPVPGPVYLYTAADRIMHTRAFFYA